MPVNGVMVPIALFVCVAVSVIGVPIARAFARRLDRQPQQPSLAPDVAARLERMEQALDTIAVEVERISEGQRFTTKLLSDRAGASGVPERLP
ncbi:MAG: hypothetical protein ABJF01_24970 [bacterium]